MVTSDHCLRCWSPLDDSQITRNHRFCSPECAKATILFRNYEVGYWADSIGQSAFRLAHRAKFAPRACRHCGSNFRPAHDESEQIYCSTKCAALASRTVPDCTCEQCGQAFHRATGTTRRAKYCSIECVLAARRQYSAEKACVWCGAAFVAAGKKAKFCSPACRQADSALRAGELPKKLRPHVFDHYLAVEVEKAPHWISVERFDELLEMAA